MAKIRTRPSATRQQSPSGPVASGGLHRQVALTSLRGLLSTPLATLLTVAVIAIALALPGIMLVGLYAAQGLSQSWEGGANVSLYLSREWDDAQGRDLAQQLAENTQIASVSYLSREQSLQEFKRFSGYANLLAEVENNPLPAVIIVEPGLQYRDSAQLQQLQLQLQSVDGVEHADIDMRWLQRLFELIEIARRILILLALLLAAGVLLVIGNTIRLAIDGRRQEIEVIKLVGGTDSYVRRPFLYSGLWYGGAGGVLAWIMVSAGLFYLAEPVERLLGLYLVRGLPQGIDFLGFGLGLVLTGMLLGLCGAYLAVNHQIRRIEPR